MQILADGKAKRRFVSLASSILGGESVLNEISYLHSPESKYFLLVLISYYFI